MAQTRKLNPDQTQALAALVGPECLLYEKARTHPGALSLLESFPLFSAFAKDLDAIRDRHGRIAGACRETGAWHSQIAVEGQVTLYARSTFPPGSNQPQLLAVGDGTLPDLLDRAIMTA